MSDNNNTYKTLEFLSLNEFWDYLDPQNGIYGIPTEFIFRGQRDSSWGLLPNILRQERSNPVLSMWGEEYLNADNQVYSELIILKEFINHCDSLGLKIINDSVQLREEHINTQTADKYYKSPSEWPNRNILEILALAQHHGVPTRLLDWTKRSFVAAYFAASKALKKRRIWKKGDKMSVWALDIAKINLYKNIEIVKVPGSASSNLAAQAGLFTIHRQEGKRGEKFIPKPMESEFEKLPNSPLCKVTLPVENARQVLKLCALYGVTASTLFPGFDGAAKAVIDSLNVWDKKK